MLDCLSEDNIIGRGGAGTVYKGVMPSGEIVAVKRLAGEGKGASHDHGFSAEIQTLGKIRHRNIVRLLGCCSNHETNLLVYEYMPKGSLGELLHSKEKSGNLSWETRWEGSCLIHHPSCVCLNVIHPPHIPHISAGKPCTMDNKKFCVICAIT